MYTQLKRFLSTYSTMWRVSPSEVPQSIESVWNCCVCLTSLTNLILNRGEINMPYLKIMFDNSVIAEFDESSQALNYLPGVPERYMPIAPVVTYADG
jgi:hypothetical protein